MAGSYCSKGNEEYCNMSDGTVISCSLQSDDRWILHRERQQPGKNTLRACSAIIAFLKRLGAIIDRCSDIGIASKICNAPVSFKKFRMKPRAGGIFFGKFFRMGNWANKLQPDFSTVFELAPVKHLKTGNAYKATTWRKFDIGAHLPARVTSYSRDGF